MRSLLSARTTYVFLLALSICVLRLLIFDFPEYFERRSIPNHDLYQGAGLFCPSMHSVRTSGDLAWWNPAGTQGGYAQYYNAFFSPLAPTSGHIVSIVWSQLIVVLSWCGIAFPEYLQYLTVNLIVLPCLAYAGLGTLAQLLFRSRVTVALVVLVYAFSGIGLWNSAWFYYQEAATVFFLLSAAVAVFQRPTVPRVAALAAATLVQLASVNYWTLYNSWFVLVFLGAYAAVYRHQVRRLAFRLFAISRAHFGRTCCLVAIYLLVAAMWAATLGSVLWEQSGKYFRNSDALNGGPAFREERALARVQEMRRYTTELFNPKLQRALSSYKIENEIHNARYLGMVLLPWFVSFWFLPLRRRELFLSATTGAILVICLAPPWLLKLWATVPFMDHIRHFFYFYSHHLQLLIVLLSSTVLDRALSGRLSALSQQRLKPALTFSMAACLIILIGMGLLSHHFPARDSSLESILMAAILALVAAAISRHLLGQGNYEKRLVLCALLLLIATADVTRYYCDASKLDQHFTVERFGGPAQLPLPLTPIARSALKQPWELPAQAGQAHSALFANMPIANDFWPTNRYNQHKFVHEWLAMPAEVRTRLGQEPIAFYPTVSDTGPQGDLFYGPGDRRFRVIHSEVSYNDFSLEFVAPTMGCLVTDVLHDSGWHVHLDGQPVEARRGNLIGTSTRVPAGRHQLHFHFAPLARHLYWPACWLLELALAGLAVIAGKQRASMGEKVPIIEGRLHRASLISRHRALRRFGFRSMSKKAVFNRISADTSGVDPSSVRFYKSHR